MYRGEMRRQDRRMPSPTPAWGLRDSLRRLPVPPLAPGDQLLLTRFRAGVSHEVHRQMTGLSVTRYSVPPRPPRGSLFRGRNSVT